MQVNTWGPPLWTVLHTMSMNAPNRYAGNEAESVYEFIRCLGKMLPCAYCRQSYHVFLAYLPPEDYIDGREGFVYWVYVLHNLVNYKLGKPLPYPTLEEVIRKFEAFRAPKAAGRDSPVVAAVAAGAMQIRYYDSMKPRIERLMRDLREAGNDWSTLYTYTKGKN